MPIKKLTLMGFSIVVLALALLTSYKPVSASPVTGFNAANIIDDSVFIRYKSMSESQIKSFLNSKGSSCTTGNCLKNYTQGGKSSARIIYEAARDYKINPQVLIVLLQKETALITINNPSSWRYRTATGYGCPDSSVCDTQYYGFKNQVRNSAKMFRYIMDRNPNWDTPYIVGNNHIYWHPSLGSYVNNSGNKVRYDSNHDGKITSADAYKSGCGYTNVNIQNQATVALYSYTPYRPNSSALNAGYGEGNSCSAYGNRNFYQYFKDWFGSVRGRQNNIRLISCSDSSYMIERGRKYKRAITDIALETWNLEDKTFIENDPGCSYPTYDTRLNRLIRSRKTGKLYVVDKGNYYYIPNQTIANAWGFGSISQAVPQMDSYSITDNLEATGTLPRLTVSDNYDNGTYYLVDGGNRYAIAGTSSGDTSSLDLIRGYKEVPAARLSVGLIQTLSSASTIDYSFKIGSDWYLLNHNETRKISSTVRSIWAEFLTGPSLSSSALSIFGDNLTIGNGFHRNDTYYRVRTGSKFDRTTSASIASNWVNFASPTITQLLTNKIVGNTTSTSSYDTLDSGDIRLITCGNNKYLVERYIRRKRPITTAGLAAWGFTNRYFYVNDPGCSYTPYDVPADVVIRSRSSDKVYYLDNQTAYYAESQNAADAWNLGDLESSRFPVFVAKNITDNLDIIRNLPPPPLP